MDFHWSRLRQWILSGDVLAISSGIWSLNGLFSTFCDVELEDIRNRNLENELKKFMPFKLWSTLAPTFVPTWAVFISPWLVVLNRGSNKPTYIGDCFPFAKFQDPGSFSNFFPNQDVMEISQPRVLLPPAWRIIPFSKGLITMVSKSPKWGCSPYKWPKYPINGGY